MEVSPKSRRSKSILYNGHLVLPPSSYRQVDIQRVGHLLDILEGGLPDAEVLLYLLVYDQNHLEFPERVGASLDLVITKGEGGYLGVDGMGRGTVVAGSETIGPWLKTVRFDC